MQLDTPTLIGLAAFGLALIFLLGVLLWKFWPQQQAPVTSISHAIEAIRHQAVNTVFNERMLAHHRNEFDKIFTSPPATQPPPADSPK